MSEIIRYDVNDQWAHSGMVEAGDFLFMSYCVGNIGQPIENQINGAFDHLSKRLSSIRLTLELVVKFDALFKNIRDIPIMEKVIKKRFDGKYPARKSLLTEFAGDGILFQIDAIAYKKGYINE